MTAAGRPQPGPHRPVRGTAPRVPGSVRRTTSIDTSFPDGLGGRVVIHIRGRDLHTRAVGGVAVLDDVVATLAVDPWTASITGVDATSAGTPFDALVGLPLRGLRRRLADLYSDGAARRSLCFSALEDLAGAYLVSGYAGLRTGLIGATLENAEFAVQTQADVCIGWAFDGPVIETIRATRQHAVPVGPPAPVLEREDALGWHEMPPLSAPSVRRRRRTDVRTPTGDDEPLHVEHHFRDSYAAAGGEEVMHEYVVHATFDGLRRLQAIDVDARVLPWYECPGATVSAQRLVGTALDEIAARVTAEFSGASTCTHLNSTLRTLADAQALDRTPS